MDILPAGTRVIYVPRHDGEYNHQPAYGVVRDFTAGYYEIEPIDLYETHSRVSVRQEYVAATYSHGDVLRLIRLLNDMVLKYQSDLYMVELDLQHDKESKAYKRIKSLSHYHIN